MKSILLLACAITWTAVSIVMPFSLTWWVLLGLAIWVIGSFAIFLSLVFVGYMPDTWYVRLFFLPPMWILS